ncbi:MAG: hypothetical protein RMJ17_01010 [Candidatus Aenigmarchaeota archaeon]|nr:hypothetical protein [Candidatus Aenigmarchaeota archaeon]MDW8149165.1 hypothetical protein [Candidatus Aenigmarchaeota archaeon]
MYYDAKSNCYVYNAYLGNSVLGMRIGFCNSHIYGNPAIIYISSLVKEEDVDYVKLHEVIHMDDEYITRIITESLALDLYDKKSPLSFYK